MRGDQKLLFGVYLDALRMDDVIARCRTAILTRSRVVLGVLNAAKVVNMRYDPLLRDSLIGCDLLLADGQSIVWASKLLRRPLPERLAGIDIFEHLLALAHEDGRSVYLLGARADVLESLKDRLSIRYPGLHIAGSHHGYFDANDASDIAADIRNSGADMLFLGMVSPKKEVFLGAYGSTLGVPVLHGVGGSFDILAGLTRRAPIAWQRIGMEWAYRLLQEPRRLWWRYVKTNTAFVLLTVSEFVRPAPAFKPTTLLTPMNIVHKFKPGGSRAA